MAILGAMQLDWIDAEIFTVYSLIGALLVLSGAIMVVIPKRKKLR
jgi:hypothetical protein